MNEFLWAIAGGAVVLVTFLVGVFVGYRAGIQVPDKAKIKNMRP